MWVVSIILVAFYISSEQLGITEGFKQVTDGRRFMCISEKSLVIEWRGAGGVMQRDGETDPSL